MNTDEESNMTEQKEKPLLLMASKEALARVNDQAMHWWNHLRGNENPDGGNTHTQTSAVMEFLLNSEGVTMYPHKQWKATQNK